MPPNRSQVSRFPVKLDIESSSSGLSKEVRQQRQQNHDVVRGPSSSKTAHPDKARDSNVDLYQASRDQQEGSMNDFGRLYWEWPSDSQAKNVALVASILQDEFARRMVSVEKMEQDLNTTIESSLRQDQPTTTTIATAPNHDSYWQWDAAPSPKDHGTPTTATMDVDSYWEWKSPSDEEEKSEIIQRILREEAYRQMFTVEKLEEQLLKAAVFKEETRTDHSSSQQQQPISYWDF